MMTLNIFHTFAFMYISHIDASIVDSKQANVDWEAFQKFK